MNSGSSKNYVCTTINSQHGPWDHEKDWEQTQQMGNCGLNHQHFQTNGELWTIPTSSSQHGMWGLNQGLGFPSQTRNCSLNYHGSQHGTVELWKDNSIGRSTQKEQNSEPSGTYPWPSEMAWKTENSKSSQVPCLCFLLSPKPSEVFYQIVTLTTNLFKKKKKTE